MNSQTLDNTTLVLTWQPPGTTNGDILHYVVRITLSINEDIIIVEENVMTTVFTVAHLSRLNCYVLFNNMPINGACFVGPGIPYDVKIVPVNLAGQGQSRTETYFTQELSKSNLSGQLLLSLPMLSSQCGSYGCSG